MKGFFREYRLIIIPIFLVVVVIVSLSFILTNVSHDDNALSVDYLTENKIVVSNRLPMTDEVGKMISSTNNKDGVTGYLEFEVRSNTDDKVNYEVYLTKEDLDVEVSPKFVKVYLTDDNDVALGGFDVASLPTYYDLRLSDIDPSGKLLYSGKLKNKGSQKFKLRMWVADTYELTTDSKMFSVRLNVKVK